MAPNNTKTNWGTIPSIPELCVNKFPPNIEKNPKWDQMFFMTHYDPEILTEVLNIKFLKSLETDGDSGARLFLHDLMYEYLIFWCETTYVQDKDVTLVLLKSLKKSRRIVCCPTGESVGIFCNAAKKIIKVTMLPSGYDVGCVMLLFSVCFLDSTDVFNVLYTGNCRVSLKDLKGSPFLCEGGEMMKIDQLYLDTSYLHEEISELPPRSDSTEQLIASIKEKMDNNPELHFEFTNQLPGVLARILSSISEEICQSIHVPSALAKFCSKIPAVFGSFTDRFDPEELRVHLGCRELTHNKHCSDADWKSYVDVMKIVLWQEVHRAPLHGKAIRDEPADYLAYTSTGDPVLLTEFNVEYEDPDRIFCMNHAHLSRFEIGRMIKLLGVPITEGTIFPLYMEKNKKIQDVMDLLMITVLEMPPREPRKYISEHFAYSYDYTGIPSMCQGMSTQMYNFDSIVETEVTYP